MRDARQQAVTEEKYFRKEMKDSTSMQSHLKEMKELTDKLASIGTAIAEEDQVVTLLGSLPSSYSTIITALVARVDNVSLDFVQQALIHEEQKQKDASKPLLLEQEIDLEDHLYVGIAKRLVTFSDFVRKGGLLTNLTRPLQPNSTYTKMRASMHFL